MVKIDEVTVSDSDASGSSRKPIGVCFACRKPGHWSKDCPNRGPLSYPVMQCHCGAGPCVVLISRTEKNPGRQFFKCPKCKFFKWCDEVGKSPGKQQFNGKSPAKQKNADAESSKPTCGCGAGKCITRTEAGREYYACPIKKGQGACNYKQWLDSPAKPSEPKEDHLGQNRISSPVLPTEPNRCEVVNKSPGNSLVRGPLSRYLVERYNSSTILGEMEHNCNEQLGRSNAKDINSSPGKAAHNSVGQFGSAGTSSVEIYQHDQFKSCQVTEEPKNPEIDYNGAGNNPRDNFILLDLEIKEQEVCLDNEANKTNYDANPEPAFNNAAFLPVSSRPVIPKGIHEPHLSRGSPSKGLALCDGSSNTWKFQYSTSECYPGQMLTDGAPSISGSPLSLKRVQRDIDKDASSPGTMQRGECYRCGALGHSTDECKKMTGIIHNDTNIDQQFTNPAPVSPRIVHKLNGFVPPNRLGCSPKTSRRGECLKCGSLGHWMSECPENMETTNSVNPEQQFGNAVILAELPPVTPKRVHPPARIVVSSPLTRSSLCSDSPKSSRYGECYTCGQLGHSSHECSNNFNITKNVANPEQKLGNAAYNMISPPLSPMGVHTPGNSVASPLKRLSLSNGSKTPTKPGRCYKCNKEGHWYKECPN